MAEAQDGNKILDLSKLQVEVTSEDEEGNKATDYAFIDIYGTEKRTSAFYSYKRYEP